MNNPNCFVHEQGRWLTEGTLVRGYACAAVTWDRENPAATREEVVVIAPTPDLAAQAVAKLHPDLTIERATVQLVAFVPQKGLQPLAGCNPSDANDDKLIDDLIALVESDVVVGAEERSHETKGAVAALKVELQHLREIASEHERMREAFEKIDIKAGAGLCQMTHAGTREFLKDVREIVADTVPAV